jgi:renalase
MSEKTVAIIGAGLAGATCACALAARGLQVQVFDKARGAGGRMSTRRRGEARFDHGAPYFSARSERFRQEIEAWQAAGVVAPWPANVVGLKAGVVTPGTSDTDRYVGTPTMNAVQKHLLTTVPLSAQTRIERLERVPSGWQLRSDAGVDLGTFSAVVITTPPEQAVPLLEPAPHLAESVRQARMAPCWVAMVQFAEPMAVPYDAAFVEAGPLAYICLEDSKPQREAAHAWVLHGSPDWSASQLEAGADQVSGELLAAMEEATGVTPPPADHVDAHRWRYAQTTQPLHREYLWDDELGLGVAADWCTGDRAEGAFLSGLALAEAVRL